MAEINLYNVDCMEFMKGVPDKAYDLAIVDPPYGINHANKAAKMAGQQYGKAAAKKKDYAAKDWDLQTPDAGYFSELFRVSKNQIVWGANYMTSNLPEKSGWIFWDKVNGNNNFSDGELAWTSFDKGLRMYRCTWNGMIQYDMKNKEDRFHPTQKPVKLYKWLLTTYAKSGEIIFDSHLGSGSIAIACHDLKFDLVGCEIDKDYFDKALRWIDNHQKQLKMF